MDSLINWYFSWLFAADAIWGTQRTVS